MYGYMSNRRGDNMSKKIVDRIGEENHNRKGTLMRIIEYNNAKDIIVEFQDEYKVKVHTEYKHFKKGNIKNPYDKSVWCIGYIGEGRYNIKNHLYIYDKWHDMLKRCYDPYYLNKELTYVDCYVCEEWHNFQNFGKWYEENYYEVEEEKMHLDKDILIKGNKIYSPNTCIFVPERINKLFIGRDTVRGKYPIGVSWYKIYNKFMASCNANSKRIHLGYYDTIEEAFLAYKTFKEKYIKEVADEYKDLIPTKLYEAMYSYEIEIND